MSSSVFPVGHYGGLRPGEVPGAAQVHAVRVGWRQLRLSEDAFGVWVLSHGSTETGKGPWTTDDIIQQADQAGVADAKAHLENLVSDGALVLVPDRPDEAVVFAQSHRMEVLFVGLGNTPDRPDGYAVGLPGLGTAAILDPDCYELWQWGSVAPTLWHSSEVRSEVAGQLGRTLEPVAALAQIMGDLRYLIVHGCAYLDIAAAHPEAG
jgi:hypothetical protein